MLFAKLLALAGAALATPFVRQELETLWTPEEVIPEGANIVYYDWNLTVETRNIEGNYRETFLINGQMPGPAIEGDQGDWVVVNVHNYLSVPTTVHFHGIHNKKTPFSDGAAGITQWPILSGDSFTYVFELEQYGMYWYHSHYRGYNNDGVVGPIYIRPGADVGRPYADIVLAEDVALLEELEKSPNYLLLIDWFKLTFDAVASKMFSFGMDPTCVRTMLANGKGRHICMDQQTITNEAHTKTGKFLELVSENTTIDSYGCLDLLSLNGYTSIDYDKALLEFPGYNTECVNATTDVEIIYTEGQKYVMLNMLNTGGEFSKMLSIDDHNITALAVDGEFINPISGQQVYMPIGQRVTAIVETDPSKHEDVSKPFMIRFASNDMPQITEGFAYLMYGHSNSTNATSLQTEEVYPDTPNGVQYQNRGGVLLSDDFELVDPRLSSPYNTSLVPPSGPADHTIYLYLNRLGAVTFTVYNNITMNAGMELNTPYLFQAQEQPTMNLSAVAGALIDVGIELGDTVDIIFQNSPLADHPMHLHGHTFWSIAHNDSIDTFPYSSVEEAIEDGSEDLFNFVNPAYVDNAAVLTGGWHIVRLVADNPGVWMIHCHFQTHVAAGMSAAFVSAKDQIPEIPMMNLLQGHADYEYMTNMMTPSELNITLT